METSDKLCPSAGQVLFTILICDPDGGMKRTFSKLAGDAKLTCGFDIPERQDAIQKGLDKLVR